MLLTVLFTLHTFRPANPSYQSFSKQRGVLLLIPKRNLGNLSQSFLEPNFSEKSEQNAKRSEESVCVSRFHPLFLWDVPPLLFAPKCFNGRMGAETALHKTRHSSECPKILSVSPPLLLSLFCHPILIETWQESPSSFHFFLHKKVCKFLLLLPPIRFVFRPPAAEPEPKL